MSDTYLTAPTRFINVDGDRFAYRRWDKAVYGQEALLLVRDFRGGMDHRDLRLTDGQAEGRRASGHLVQWTWRRLVIRHSGQSDLGYCGRYRRVIRALVLRQVDLLIVPSCARKTFQDGSAKPIGFAPRKIG